MLSAWKKAVCSMGFESVKYLSLLQAKRSHAFAFRTSSVAPEAAGSAELKMWISQDFNAAFVEEEPTKQPSQRREEALFAATQVDTETIPVAIIGGGIGGAALALVDIQTIAIL